MGAGGRADSIIGFSISRWSLTFPTLAILPLGQHFRFDDARSWQRFYRGANGIQRGHAGKSLRHYTTAMVDPNCILRRIYLMGAEFHVGGGISGDTLLSVGRPEAPAVEVAGLFSRACGADIPAGRHNHA